MDFAPHHLGCAVKTLASGLTTYGEVLMSTPRTRAFNVTSQDVSVLFLRLQGGFYLELVAPLGAGSRITNYLPAGFYHLCFLTRDLAAARTHLKGKGFAALPAFSSEAFAGADCQFFVSPEMHLIELAQISTEEFEAFFASNLASC